MAQGKYLNGNGLKYLWQNIIKSYIDDVVAELNIYSPTTSSVWEVPYVDIDGLYDSKGVHLVCRKNQLVGISIYDEVMEPHRRPVYAPNGVLYVDSSSNFDLTIGGKTFNIAMGEQWIDLDLVGVANLNNTFQNNNNILSLSLCMDTSQLREIRYTFAGCTNLISLDLSQWNTTNVTNMTHVFQNCSSLTTLDVSKWNTAACTNMVGMFSGCSSLSSLASLDVSGWNTATCTNMRYMFNGCSSLTSLDVSGWNTGACTNMGGMFNGCSALTSLDVSGWDTAACTDMSNIFYGCKQLASLDPSKWNTEQCTNMHGIFCACESLIDLDLTSFTMTNVANVMYIFFRANAPMHLKFPNMGQLKADTDYNKSIDLSYSPLDRASLDSIFSYDRTANGLSNPLTVILSKTSKALLTPEEIAAITAKGYTIT